MKAMILTLALTICGSLAHAGAGAVELVSPARQIVGWNSEIPTTMMNVLETLKYEAIYYSFDTDEGKCGGQIYQPELVDHRTIRDENGVAIHELILQFELSKARKFCASVIQTTCQAVVQIHPSQHDVTIDGWVCEK